MEHPRAILLLAKSGGFVPQFELQNVRLLREMGYRIFYAADFSRGRSTVCGRRNWTPRCDENPDCGFRTPLAICSHLGELKKLKELTEAEHITAVHCHTPVGVFWGGCWAGCRERTESDLYCPRIPFFIRERRL